MSDEPPAIEGAANAIGAGLREPPHIERLDRPPMPIAEVERILGLARRDFSGELYTSSNKSRTFTDHCA